MIHKLMQHTVTILIGHRYIVFIIVLLMLPSCSWIFENWENNEDNHYRIEIKNQTIHTIEIDFKPSNTRDSYTIEPDSILLYSNFGVTNDQGVIAEGLFGDDDNRFSENRVVVYWQDSLSIEWNGPPFEIADSLEHSFFNINSWEYWNYEPALGVVRFTIIPADLKIIK